MFAKMHIAKSRLRFRQICQTLNRIALYNDHPNRWDAWDVDIHYLESPLVCKLVAPLKIVAESETEVTLESKHLLGSGSLLTQVIHLKADSPFIEVQHFVEWSEAHSFLRVLFETNVRASHAKFGIQHGLVERSTHNNTSWDVAQFEVPFQNWFALHEPNRGIAVLCAEKFGASVKGQMLGLSLLRSPKWPDCLADNGLHSYTYAIFPFQGSFSENHIPLRARQLAFRWAEVSEFPLEQFVTCDAKNIIIESIKISENKKGVVLRFFEAEGGLSYVNFEFTLVPQRMFRCDICENLLEEIDSRILVKPFQIVSLYLEFAIEDVL